MHGTVMEHVRCSCADVGKAVNVSMLMHMHSSLTNAAESIDGHIELLRLGDLL